jgi:DNA (cytosine-5)-methyltransferase 1
MWSEAIRAVRELMPRAFLFENVQGLLRPAFFDYIKYIERSLTWPELARRPGEDWKDHARRLEQHHWAQRDYPTYKVRFGAINSADFGSPQRRHRALVIGVRADVAWDWDFPAPTHSKESLAFAQYASGDYWTAHGLWGKAHLADQGRECRSVREWQGFAKNLKPDSKATSAR